MKKILKYIVCFIWFLIISISSVARTFDLWNPWDTRAISEASVKFKDITWSPQELFNEFWYWILKQIKRVTQWLIVIVIVMIWWKMALSMWDTKAVEAGKKQISYALLWILFINIPWTIYNSFWKKDKWADIDINTGWWFTENARQNILFNSDTFASTVEWSIVGFLKVLLVAISVRIIVYNWIKIINSHWKEDVLKEWKAKLLYWITWLLMVMILNPWIEFIFNAFWWKSDAMWDWVSIFKSIANLCLYFAWPTVIVFLSLAWYYFIPSWWDESKIKKAKSILTNTIFWVLILLASYAVLNDLWKFMDWSKDTKWNEILKSNVSPNSN